MLSKPLVRWRKAVEDDKLGVAKKELEMFENLIEATSLPNLHPALVHFPIACLPLALAFEGAGLALRRQRWLAPAATTLYGIGALGAWLALWAGERAADSLVGVPAAVQPRIGEHSDWAHYALYSLIAVAAVRLAIQLRPQLSEHRGARVGVLILGLAALGVLGKAADLGGALVYQHALAVERPEPVTPEAPAAVASTDVSSTPVDSALDRLVSAEDGTLAWRPAPGDAEALGAILSAAPGSDLGSVRALAPDNEGLRLTIDRPVTLLLPGTFGDVQVELVLDPLDFEGSIGLVHHYRTEGDRGAFSISTEGTAILDDLRQGDRTLLDQKQTEIPTDPFELAVSASGKHLKGLVDGKTVTHGHIAAGPEGSCGLRLEGTGTLRILQVAVRPLEAH